MNASNVEFISRKILIAWTFEAKTFDAILGGSGCI